MHTCWALALIGLAACGRLGFDAAGHDEPDPDGALRDAAITAPLAFTRLCAYQAFRVIDDANAVDDATGMQLASATRAGCATMAVIDADALLLAVDGQLYRLGGAAAGAAPAR